MRIKRKALIEHLEAHQPRVDEKTVAGKTTYSVFCGCTKFVCKERPLPSKAMRDWAKHVVKAVGKKVKEST